MHKCQTCKEVKASTEFYNSAVTANRLSARCKACDKIARRDSISRSPATRAGYYRRMLARKYGLTPTAVEDMLTAQDGSCAICKTTNPLGEGNTSTANSSFCVDHCHTTGRIRGMLCNACNRGLGFFRDSKENLRNAIAYLGNCH
jgi:hypothetical protein